MKVSELTGDKLDYWVAKAQGWNLDTEYDDWCNYGAALIGRKFYTPTTNWQQCGELIEKFKMYVEYDADEYWNAHTQHMYGIFPTGSTPQEAICRAVVASVYGDEVSDE